MHHTIPADPFAADYPSGISDEASPSGGRDDGADAVRNTLDHFSHADGHDELEDLSKDLSGEDHASSSDEDHTHHQSLDNFQLPGDVLAKISPRGHYTSVIASQVKDLQMRVHMFVRHSSSPLNPLDTQDHIDPPSDIIQAVPATPLRTDAEAPPDEPTALPLYLPQPPDLVQSDTVVSYS